MFYTRLLLRVSEGALPAALAPLVQRAQWRLAQGGVDNIEKLFEFKSGAVASQFVAQGVTARGVSLLLQAVSLPRSPAVKDVALRVHSISIGIDVDSARAPSIVRIRIPSDAGVVPDLDPVSNAAHLVDDAAAELQLAGGGWK